MNPFSIRQATRYSFHFLLFAFCLLHSVCLWSSSKNDSHPTSAVLSNIRGNIWVENDENSTYNGESGPSGVLVFLYNNEEDTIVSQSISVGGTYVFNNIPAGNYYLRIDASAFNLGGPLFNQQSCIGTNDANDMVDNDDNGSDTTPNDVLCSPFVLTNTDPMTNVPIEYIDFCFFSTCDEENPFLVPACEDVSPLEIFCDLTTLNNFCAITPSEPSTGNQPSTLCDGFNEPKNISWFAFIAPAGNYTINITPSNCQMGGIGLQGMQVGIYTDCTFSESVFCSSCTLNPISIGANDLTPGQLYYLFINGCNGNICNYLININGNTADPSLEPEDVCILSDGDFICNDISYCAGGDMLFQGKGITQTGSFSWSISTISGDPYLGDSMVMTNKNALTLNVPAEGTYKVCLTDVANGCSTQDWSGEVCREVTTSFAIPVPMDEDFGVVLLCEDELNLFTLDAFANLDPNGDGDFGWNAPVTEYSIGINEATVSTLGCSYEQQFTLNTFDPSAKGVIMETICQDDLPIIIDGITITELAFNGTQTFVLQDYLLLNESDINGCDSIIDINIEKLNVAFGNLTNSSCTMEGVVLDFDYIPELSTDFSFLSFVWKDPQGNIIPSPLSPFSIIAPYEGGTGEYTLDIGINKDGTFCEFSYSTFVNFADYIPLVPEIFGPTIICSGDNISEYTAVGQGDEIGFIWSYPNDVASAITSGMTNEIITIDWTGSTGGNVGVVAQNSCAQSNQTSFNVQLIPITTPDFSIDTSVCVDNPVTIDFIGSNFNIMTYTWDFNGGTVISGTGMGPYEVSWNTAGEKIVTLVTTDNNGCLSNTKIKTIPVQTPLTPTQVNCNASIGEIEFTWEIPPMVSGFEVNVLSGQTGGVFTANSFTIANLDAEEEVTIELLTMPEDPICGEFVSTTVTCVAQDCSPPQINLEADQSTCVDSETISIMATITSGETGTGIYSGPGIIDQVNGIFDPSQADIGINTILYSFTSDAADCVGSKTISIEVFDLPIASFMQDIDTFCIADAVTFQYTGTSNTDSYDWNFDGGVGNGSDTNPEVTFDNPGIKTISLQVTKDGCLSDLFTSSVLVEPEIEAITIQCDTVGTDFVTFLWNDVNGVSLFEIRIDNDPPFFTPNTTITIDNLEEEQEVTISVTTFSNTSCPASSASETCTTTKAPVSVENEVLSEIEIFPNPVQDLLFFEGIADNRLSFELYSTLGVLLMDRSVLSAPIDISSIPRGVYIVRLRLDIGNSYKDIKIVKE